MSTLYASFSDAAAAEHAAGALLDHGARSEDLTILAGEGSHMARMHRVEGSAEKGISTTTPADAASGALKGTVTGAGVGLLAALAALFVPGVGLVLGGGALAAAMAAGAGTMAAGAVAGGVVGYLKDQGVPEDVANTYSNNLAAGGVVLGVAVPTGRLTALEADALLAKYGANHVATYNNPRVAPGTPLLHERAVIDANPNLDPLVVDRVTPVTPVEPITETRRVTVVDAQTGETRTAIVESVVAEEVIDPVVPVTPLHTAATNPVTGETVISESVVSEPVVVTTDTPGIPSTPIGTYAVDEHGNRVVVDEFGNRQIVVDDVVDNSNVPPPMRGRPYPG